MTGYESNVGVIPRLCTELFRRIEATQGPEHTFKVEASFLEIYNERVRMSTIIRSLLAHVCVYVIGV